MKTFADFKIDLGSRTGIEVAALCPQCEGTRKKKHVKCLSVNTEKGVWVCHHCDWRGTLKGGEDAPARKSYVRPTWVKPAPPDVTLANWFAHRGINEDIVAEEEITIVQKYLAQAEDTVPCLAFPFKKNGEVVNVKYRGVDTKAFQQVSGAEKILYRQDSIAKDMVFVVEGEIDALSVRMAGFDSVVSVPDGAPAVNTKDFTAKFTYLDQDPDPFDSVEKIVLAVDNDPPGKKLLEELARRLGRERCWTVQWPEGCKDANDVLCTHGAEVLQTCLLEAAPWPVEDVVTVLDLAEDIRRIAQSGLPRGLSTGWPSLDMVFTIAPGQLTVVTGIPSHGKSQFVDALAVNLMQTHGWRFVICSPENYPTSLHAVTLMEKWTAKTVRMDAPFQEASMLTPAEIDVALTEMYQYFKFIAPEDSMTIDDLLERCTVLVRTWGIQGLIIDPWNEFDHTRPRGMSEVEYINEKLGAVRRWARKWSVHVFIVAHPTKMQKKEDGTYPIPTPYDISGGAAWRNKSENCITIWRNISPGITTVEIHVQKVRWRNLGIMGESISLNFNRWTGRYL